jgi:hypothetical protein
VTGSPVASDGQSRYLPAPAIETLAAPPFGWNRIAIPPVRDTDPWRTASVTDGGGRYAGSIGTASAGTDEADEVIGAAGLDDRDVMDWQPATIKTAVNGTRVRTTPQR